MAPLKRLAAAGLAILGAGLVSGCTTVIVNEFQGELRNLPPDGRTRAIHGELPGYCEGPAKSGGRYVGFTLPATEASVFIFHPDLAQDRTLVTNTGSPQTGVWLVRGPVFYWASHLAHDPEQLRRLGGEPLDGQVAIRWNDNTDFNIRVEATAQDNSTTALRGQFMGYTKLTFTPSVLWVVPAMLIFGEGQRYHPVPVTNASPAQAAPR
jgi:hypothetical protein